MNFATRTLMSPRASPHPRQVTALLDSHSLLARAVLKAASVLAHDFTLAVLELFLRATCESYDRAALASAAAELVQDEMWELTKALRYRFRHIAVRHLVYNTILPQDQRMLFHSVALQRVERQMQEQAATTPGSSDDEREFRFTAVDVAYHAEGAGSMYKAAAYYLKCTSEAAVHGSPSTALEYAHKGLGALDKLDDGEAAGGRAVNPEVAEVRYWVSERSVPMWGWGKVYCVNLLCE